MAAQLRQRPVVPTDDLPAPELAPPLTDKHRKHAPDVAHPSGKQKKSQATQWLRGFSFVAYFLTCCVAYAHTCLPDSPPASRVSCLARLHHG